MSWILTKEFRFEASHHLPQVPKDHKCHRLHGHSYRVELILVSTFLDDRGFAGGVDYADLDEFGNYIDENLDHRNLNEVLGDENTTAERIAHYLFAVAKVRWTQTTAVRVYETPKTCVEYRE